MTASKLLYALPLFLMVSFAGAQSGPTVSIPPMSVVPPGGNGWQVMRKETGITYQRVDPIAKEQRTAYARVIKFQASNDVAKIEAELKSELAGAFPQELVLGEVTYESSRTRGYPCVTAFSEATQSVPLPQEKRVLSVPVSVAIMACRNAGTVPLGLLAGYSYAAMQRSKLARQEAAVFFEGVHLNMR
ncbi:hypothetical protein [Duganella hordei]|jgi:hypothetical protein|uniref:hypothetical protein n=1 Tax=Duganella hordei TaxID=2865934 RepID=UPI0030E8180F